MSLENLSIEAQAELAALAKSLAEDPKTRKQFLQLTKQVRPDVPIPEIEIESIFEKFINATPLFFNKFTFIESLIIPERFLYLILLDKLYVVKITTLLFMIILS